MHSYVVADVFCERPLEGNSVAVFIDAAGLDATTMQRAARELNLSETVFLTGPERGDEGAFDVRARIFTPSVELPFAGHPVLGTAFVVGRDHAGDVIRIATAAGVVPVALRRSDAGVPVHGEMEQPVPSWEPFADVDALLAAVGAPSSELPVDVYVNGPRHVYVALSDAAAVARLAPDMAALRALGELGVSCFAVDGNQVKTRMFSPGMGVPEDPATGSAAGPLAVHLARHGAIGFGERIAISQGAEIGRPSSLQAVADGSPERVTRVAVGGAAVIVAEGRYRLG